MISFHKIIDPKIILHTFLMNHLLSFSHALILLSPLSFSLTSQVSGLLPLSLSVSLLLFFHSLNLEGSGTLCDERGQAKTGENGYRSRCGTFEGSASWGILGTITELRYGLTSHPLYIPASISDVYTWHWTLRKIHFGFISCACWPLTWKLLQIKWRWLL